LLEKIRAFFPEVEADFTNLIYRFASYRQATGSAANMDHTARRLDKSSFANMMAGFFLVDH
jgi:hypothetical protein